jgi:hypothetical protein
MRNRILIFSAILLCSVAWGQSQNLPPNSPPAKGAVSNGQPSMPGMDMSGASHADVSNMNRAEPEEGDAAPHAMHSMEGHVDMGPHMKMTALRPPKLGDAERAQKLLEEARKLSEKYLDYRLALADGYKIFLPNVPQKMYHFTNYGYAIEAGLRFNPEHPTSLLYEKRGNDYKLIGLMYTAPKRFGEDQLDERIPLSVAQWHQHVNFCVPPKGRRKEMFQPHPQFGLMGSIATQEACNAAGGTFYPVVLNWMIHVYPFEKDQARIWSVQRQHGDAD